MSHYSSMAPVRERKKEFAAEFAGMVVVRGLRDVVALLPSS